MIDFENNSDIDLNPMIFEPILEHLSSKDVEVIIVNDVEMRAINHQTRQKDSATDVLSFPLEEVPDATILGTIVISIDHIIKVAQHFGHSQEHEAQLLFLHGLLHLLGFDHETDDGEMREKEVSIINHFNLPQSLIIRTEES
jgi:probable rRNA maturation factor